MIQEHIEFIDTLDVNRLRGGTRWMFMRPFAPALVQELELGRYLRELLRTRRWSVASSWRMGRAMAQHRPNFRRLTWTSKRRLSPG